MRRFTINLFNRTLTDNRTNKVSKKSHSLADLLKACIHSNMTGGGQNYQFKNF